MVLTIVYFVHTTSYFFKSWRIIICVNSMYNVVDIL